MLSKLKSLFRRPTRDNEPEDINYPDAESVVDTHLPHDDFDDLQSVSKSKETYADAAEFARPKTFVEKNGWMKPASNFGIFMGHFISAATALGFSFLAAYYFTNVSNNPNWQNIATAVATCLVLLVVVIITETAKAKGESQLFTATVMRRKVTQSRRIVIFALIGLSVLLSAAGGYMAGLYYSDNTSEIKNEAEKAEKDIRKKTATLLAEKKSGFESRLARDKEVIDDWKKQLESLRNEKVMWQGVMTMPERNRKPANLLVEKIAEKEAEITRYTDEYNSNLDLLRDKEDTSVTTLSTTTDAAIGADKRKASQYGLIAVFIVMLVELVAIISHYMKAWYYRGVFLEGRATNMIEYRERGDRINADSVIAEYQRRRARDLTSEMKRLKGIANEPQQAPGYQAASSVWDTYLEDQQSPTLKSAPSEMDTQLTAKINALETEIDRLNKSIEKRPNPEKKTKPQNDASMRPQNEGSTFNHFYEQGPPDTTGMEYDVSKNEFRQMKKIQAAFDAWAKVNPGTLPTQKYLVQKTGIRSENTLKKYLQKMDLKTAGQK